MSKGKAIEMAKFRNESDEARWWASAEGRASVKHKSAEGPITRSAAERIEFGGGPDPGT